MLFYFTNAPEAFDYPCVKTLGRAKAGNCRGTWRVIEVLDFDRFESYQEPRYNSGCYIAVGLGHEMAAYFQLSVVAYDDEDYAEGILRA
jgi:hypothetical protein